MTMFLNEKTRLEQLRRDAAEREMLERKEAEEQARLEAIAKRKARNLEKRVNFDRACAEAEATRIATNRKNLPELRDVKQFLALPMTLRLKYITAFGANFQLALAERDKIGMTEADWEKLNAANVIPKGALNPEEPVYEY